MTIPLASRPTAAIIPFPARIQPAPQAQPAPPAPEARLAPPAPEARLAPPAPENRLARALASLNTAMVEQRTALAAWRGALGELKATTSGLDASLQRYTTNLRSLGGSVSALHVKARELEKWAEGAAGSD